MQNFTMRSDNLRCIKSDGTIVEPQRDGSAKGCTLTAGTWYCELGGGAAPIASETPLVGGHVQWSALVAGTLTYETSCFPAVEGGQGGANTDTTSFAATGWVPENPSTAVVPISNTSGGNASSAATITMGGSVAAECMYHLGNLGSRRVRFKFVLTVGGLVRIGTDGKGN